MTKSTYKEYSVEEYIDLITKEYRTTFEDLIRINRICCIGPVCKIPDAFMEQYPNIYCLSCAAITNNLSPVLIEEIFKKAFDYKDFLIDTQSSAIKYILMHQDIPEDILIKYVDFFGPEYWSYIRDNSELELTESFYEKYIDKLSG